MTQQALGCEEDQRNPDIAMELSSQHMEEVGRCGAVHHLKIQVGTETEESFQAPTGMLGTLTLVAMGQQHHQPRLDTPLLLCGSDILIHDHLSHIVKVTKLCLPDGESLRVCQCVAIFKPQDTIFVEWRVVDTHGSLFSTQFLQRKIFLLAILGDDLSMTVREGAPFRVLTTQSYRMSLPRQ